MPMGLKAGLAAMNALASPFVQQRKGEAPPQGIQPEIADPLINRIIGLDAAEFLDIGDVYSVDVKKGKGVFETKSAIHAGK